MSLRLRVAASAFAAAVLIAGTANGQSAQDYQLRGEDVEPVELPADVRQLADGFSASRVPSPDATRVEGDLMATRITADVVRVESRSAGRQWTVWNPRWTRAGLVLLATGSAEDSPVSHKRADRLSKRSHLALIHRFNSYATDRGLRDYEGVLGRSFSSYVSKLGVRSHWVDLGAGHAVAQRAYLHEQTQKGRAAASLTAVSLSLPPQRLDKEGFPTVDPVSAWMAREAPDNFQYIVGRVENLDQGALGRADLVTDVYGAFYYSERPDRVLRRALKSLRPGGRFYAVYSGDNNTASWLRTVRGVRIVEMGTGDGSSFVVLERTRGAVQVPKVRVSKLAVGGGQNPLLRQIEVVEKRRSRPRARRPSTKAGRPGARTVRRPRGRR